MFYIVKKKQLKIATSKEGKNFDSYTLSALHRHQNRQSIRQVRIAPYLPIPKWSLHTLARHDRHEEGEDRKTPQSVLSHIGMTEKVTELHKEL